MNSEKQDDMQQSFQLKVEQNVLIEDIKADEIANKTINTVGSIRGAIYSEMLESITKNVKFSKLINIGGGCLINSPFTGLQILFDSKLQLQD